MKRSYYSFVHDSNTSTTTAAHSFPQRPATLAAHPVYGAEPYLHNLSTASGYHLQEIPLTTPYLLHDYARDSDFQSNVWDQSLTEPYDWHNGFRFSFPPHRLTGLGITLGSLDVLPTTSQPLLIRAQSVSDPSISGNKASDGNVPTAYSECPSEDFVAHSVLPQPASSVPYSPNDFLVLEDSPAPPEGKMDLDSPFVSSHEAADFSSMSCAMMSPDVGSLGIIPDVNFRLLAAQRRSPVACVNPADITGPGPGALDDGHEDIAMSFEDPLPGPGQSEITRGSPDFKTEFPEEAMSAIVSVLAASAKQQVMEQANVAPTLSEVQQRQYVSHPGSSVQLPAFASRSTGTVDSSRHEDNIAFYGSAMPVRRSPLISIQPNILTVAPQPVAMLQQMSPVLNAHEGIELDELRRRADIFRQQNPGFELDKQFLQAFAGRLSERGELTPDFRCYVKGCSQSNKRRDHILVHVGSHVEHRPFQCDQCGMRFLRKNECKRHMSSHAGFKPFSCHICPPYLEKNFVRQDLLKRHLKVAHSAESPAKSRGRKPKREESFSPSSEYLP